MNVLLALMGAFGILMGYQQGDLIKYPVDVDTVEVAAYENGQLSVEVTGTETLSCEMPMQIVQTYEDGTLYVEIFEEATAAVACIAMVVPYNEVIPLDLPADVTEFTLDVNGVVISVNLNEMTDTPPAAPDTGRTYPQIEEVSIAQGDGQFELTVSGVEFFNCGFELIETQDVSQVDWVRVELYREIPPNVRCAGEEQPFTVTIPLDPAFNPDPTLETFAPRTFVVEVNDVIAELIFEPLENGEFNPVLLPTTREYFPITNVETTLNDENHTLTVNITAEAPDGCSIPFTTRQLHGDVVAIEVYRPAPQTIQPCPLILITHEIEVTVELPEDLADGTYEVWVNDVVGDFTIGENMSNPDVDNRPGAPAPGQILTQIDNVEVLILESFPPQLMLNVSGQHPDGCRFPVQVETSIANNTINVRIFREVPADVMCPMNIVMYEDSINIGTVDPGTYTLNVNDYTTEIQVD